MWKSIWRGKSPQIFTPTVHTPSWWLNVRISLTPWNVVKLPYGRVDLRITRLISPLQNFTKSYYSSCLRARIVKKVLSHANYTDGNPLPFGVINMQPKFFNNPSTETWGKVRCFEISQKHKQAHLVNFKTVAKMWIGWNLFFSPFCFFFVQAFSREGEKMWK